MRIGWKLPVFAVAAAAVAGWLAVDKPSRARALSVWHQLSGSALHAGEPPRKDWVEAQGEPSPGLPSGLVELTEEQDALLNWLETNHIQHVRVDE